MNHALLPSIRNATLPEKYEAAKAAMAACERIDECRDWADRAAALASYAKQADDKAMEQTALRIRARAVRRCGELLQEIERGHGPGRGKKEGTVATPVFNRKAAAEEAGLSERKAKEAQRVANVPKASFEAQVESKSPPTIKALADQGKGKTRAVPHYVKLGMTEEAFRAGMNLREETKDFATYLKSANLQDGVAGTLAKDRAELKRNVSLILKHLNELLKKL